MVFLSWNLNVVVLCSWNPGVVVYEHPRARFCYHYVNKKITHNYVNYVFEKYFNCPNLCNIYLHNVMHKRIRIINRILKCRHICIINDYM